MREIPKITITKNAKTVFSSAYNMKFDNRTGFTMRWGQRFKDDPEFCPFGPEILDIEVSEICNGINGKPCRFCYKSNSGQGRNMSLQTFKTIFDKMPLTLTQIAFGIGDIDSNPDLFDMLAYCRVNNKHMVVPNLTINGWGLTDSYASRLEVLCGAVAVSRYNPPDVCYDAVKKLTDLGMTQVNIHQMVSEETFENCMQVMKDSQEDPRLKKLNAIVFLMLKPKGRGSQFTKISEEKYQELIKTGFDLGIRMGFDSCSASAFQRTIFDREDYEQLIQMVDACESSLFSAYINVEGKFVYCSFTEDEPGWEGIDVVNCDDFLDDVWYGEETGKFREQLLKSRCEKTGCRKCPIFDLDFVEQIKKGELS